MDDPGEAADWMAGVEAHQGASWDLRPWLAMRVEQWKRVAPVVSLVIQASTLSGVIYGLVAWRGVSAFWLGVAFLGIIGLGFLAAGVYYGVLGMRGPEQEARFLMDLRDQDRLSPKEARLLALAVRAVEGDREALRDLEAAARAGRLLSGEAS